MPKHSFYTTFILYHTGGRRPRADPPGGGQAFCQVPRPPLPCVLPKRVGGAMRGSKCGSKCRGVGATPACKQLSLGTNCARPCLPQQEQAFGGAAVRPAGQPGRLLVRSAQTAECAGCPAQASLRTVGNRWLTCQHPAPFNAPHRPPGKMYLAGAPCAPRLIRCSTQRPWPATRPCSMTVVRARERSRRLHDYHAVYRAPVLAHSALLSFVKHASMVPVQQTGWPLAGLAKRA